VGVCGGVGSCQCFSERRLNNHTRVMSADLRAAIAEVCAQAQRKAGQGWGYGLNIMSFLFHL